jgi:hypothetical protein
MLATCDIWKEIQLLKLWKACHFWWLSKIMSRARSKGPVVNLTYSHHCLELCHFLALCKQAKIITLSKPGRGPKFTFYQALVRCLQIFREAYFKNNSKTHWGNQPDKFKSFWPSSTLQHWTSISLTDHIMLNLNITCMAVVFLDIEKSFYTS